MDGGSCDQLGFWYTALRCDVYIKIFINNEEKENHRTETKSDVTGGEFVFNYKTPRISDKSTIRFEMWDEDGTFKKPDECLLNKTLTIDTLRKQSTIKINAGSKNLIDNYIIIEGSAWKYDYQTL